MYKKTLTKPIVYEQKQILILTAGLFASSPNWDLKLHTAPHDSETESPSHLAKQCNMAARTQDGFSVLQVAGDGVVDEEKIG